VPGAPYTAAQVASLNAGFHYAFDVATENLSCVEYFAGLGSDADTYQIAQAYGYVANAMAATTYRILPLASPSTGAATIGASDVFINSTGVFFTATPAADGSVTVFLPDSVTGAASANTFVSVQALQGFMLLHELGHQLGLYGADTTAVDNGRNSRAILDHCFERDARGRYQAAQATW